MKVSERQSLLLKNTKERANAPNEHTYVLFATIGILIRRVQMNRVLKNKKFSHSKHKVNLFSKNTNLLVMGVPGNGKGMSRHFIKENLQGDENNQKEDFMKNSNSIHMKSLADLHNKAKKALNKLRFMTAPLSRNSSFCSHYMETTERFISDMMIEGELDFETIPREIRINSTIYLTAFKVAGMFADPSRQDGGSSNRLIKYLRIIIEDILHVTQYPKNDLYGYVLDDVLYFIINRLEFYGCWGDAIFKKFMEEEFSAFVKKLCERVGEQGIIST